MDQRITYIDNLKGFAILMVVLGHSIQKSSDILLYQPLFKLILSFHMPLFMAISGYCGFKTKFDFWHSTTKRFKRLIIPYFVWGIIAILLFREDPSNLLLKPNRNLWFLWDLFFITLVVNTIMIACKYSKRVSVPVLLTMALILLGGGQIYTRQYL